MTTPRLIIDGDVLLYQFTHACEKAYVWDDDTTTLSCDIVEARERIVQRIHSIAGVLKIPLNRTVLALSHSTNWRKTLYPEYKASRKGTRKPLGFSEVRDWLLENFETHQAPLLEADDIMGMFSTRHGNTIIASIDKDMRGIPGLLYNPDHPDDGIVEVSVPMADKWHMMQTLVGDRVDNYPGCPGIGAVTAQKVLDAIPRGDLRGMWAAVLSCFDKAGLSAEYAAVQATVARILRTGEWDKRKGEVKWKPPAL